MAKITPKRKVSFTKDPSYQPEWLYMPQEQWYFDTPWDQFHPPKENQ